jgi:hypothetical protein
VGRELRQRPRRLSAGEGWQEEIIGQLEGVFFEVRRRELVGDAPAPDDTAGRFHVLNVVEGTGITVETAGGRTHRLNYAETIVVPAAVGRYRLRRVGAERVRVVKALVP